MDAFDSPGKALVQGLLAFLGAAIGLLGAAFLATPGNPVSIWITSNLGAASWIGGTLGVVFLILCLVPAFWIWRDQRYDVPFPPLPPKLSAAVLNPLMRAAYDCLVARHALVPHEVKLRATLFVMDFRTKRLRQAARYGWYGVTGLSAATVQVDTGDVGRAWSSRLPATVAWMSSAGFEGSLLLAGVASGDIALHSLKDRQYMAAVPVFPVWARQLTTAVKDLSRRNRPPTAPIAVLSVDAATPEALPADWYVEPAKVVLPAVALALAGFPDAKARGAAR